jgi:hypothetical protein
VKPIELAANLRDNDLGPVDRGPNQVRVNEFGADVQDSFAEPGVRVS